MSGENILDDPKVQMAMQKILAFESLASWLATIEPETQKLAYQVVLEKINNKIKYTEGRVTVAEILESDQEQCRNLEQLRLGVADKAECVKNAYIAAIYFIAAAKKQAEIKSTKKQKFNKGLEESVIFESLKLGIASPEQQKLAHELMLESIDDAKEEAKKPKKQNAVFDRNFNIYIMLEAVKNLSASELEFNQNVFCKKEAVRCNVPHKTVLREYQKWKSDPKKVRQAERIIKEAREFNQESQDD